MKNKKGISPIIATILLIVIALTAAAFVAFFAVPFVKDQLKKAECMDAIGQVTIDTTSKYTCYTTAAGKLNFNVSVKRGEDSLDITSFKIIAYGDGTSETFDIVNGTAIAGWAAGSAPKVTMLNTPATGGDVTVPMRNGMKTYNIKTSFTGEMTNLEIAPIIKGNNFCPAVDNKPIEKCM